MAFIFTKKWREERKQKAEQRKQQRLNRLKKNAMDKMHYAELNYKKDKSTIREACVAVFESLRAGVKLDPKDPVFRNFKQHRIWVREMERVCKERMDASTQIEQRLLKYGSAILKYIGSFFGIIGDITSDDLANNARTKSIYSNQDLWDEFYENIDDGTGGAGGGNIKGDHGNDVLLSPTKQNSTSKSLKDIFKKKQFYLKQADFYLPNKKIMANNYTRKGKIPKWSPAINKNSNRAA